MRSGAQIRTQVGLTAKLTVLLQQEEDFPRIDHPICGYHKWGTTLLKVRPWVSVHPLFIGLRIVMLLIILHSLNTYPVVGFLRDAAHPYSFDVAKLIVFY